jgi:hypothetical protein
MSSKPKSHVDIMKMPIKRTLLIEWVESFAAESVEEFRNAHIWGLEERLFIPIKYRGKDRDGYCNHAMNVIECSCWEWCELARNCPQINKEGQKFAIKLKNKREWS